ncbi:MAG: response regulator transcription factor [Lachnospiraceae bacterium]|nr:response regulator transcription factor [Lachnospiraceae bacterium]
MHYSVLIVDDEVELSEYTARYFNMSGVETTYRLDAKSAMDFFEDNTCSLVLLDINLGEDSGFDLCCNIRRTMDIPIFFISARSAEDDMLLGLSIGGDDYICKPYSLSVLLAKVKAELKRYEESRIIKIKKEGQREISSDAKDDGLVKIGNVVINLKKAVVTREETDYPLKAMEYKLLVYMLNNKNRVISKDEFFEKIWDTQFVGDVTLNVHMRHLREKIEDDPGNPIIIKTVWGVGFIFEA